MLETASLARRKRAEQVLLQGVSVSVTAQRECRRAGRHDVPPPRKHEGTEQARLTTCVLLLCPTPLPLLEL